jgi:hypothetical protein
MLHFVAWTAIGSGFGRNGRPWAPQLFSHYDLTTAAHGIRRFGRGSVVFSFV